MRFNQTTFDNFPEIGELVWFSQDSSGGGPIKDKVWTLALFLGPTDENYLNRYGHTSYVRALIDGRLEEMCHISRFHRGEAPPDEGDWK